VCVCECWVCRSVKKSKKRTRRVLLASTYSCMLSIPIGVFFFRREMCPRKGWHLHCVSRLLKRTSRGCKSKIFIEFELQTFSISFPVSFPEDDMIRRERIVARHRFRSGLRTRRNAFVGKVSKRRVWKSFHNKRIYARFSRRQGQGGVGSEANKKD